MHEKEIGRFRRGDWEMDSVSMTLTQNATPAPARFGGKGYLRQLADGSTSYRLYVTTVENADSQIGLLDFGTSGVLIEEDRYYSLEAVDQFGISWKVEQTIPNFHTSWVGDSFQHVVSGIAEVLSCDQSCRVATKPIFYLKLVYFGDVEIPANAASRIFTTVAGERRGESYAFDAARFDTAFGAFRVRKCDGMISVEVDSNTKFPQRFESRVTESLMFILAKPLLWNASVYRGDGNESFRIRSKSRDSGSRVGQPIGGTRGDIDLSREAWRLFENYLSLVCTHPGEDYHTCSRYLYEVLEASASNMTAWGLALGVSVEGIVKAMFPKAGAPMAGMKTVIRGLKAHCQAWDGYPPNELGESVVKRLPGMIDQLLNASTKDKLYALARDRVIRESHIKSWSDLRNALAHGVTPGSDDLQVLIDLCHQVSILMYHLIFNACGYEGWYVDYSTRDWPMRRYRGRPATEEEIAVSAYFIYLKSGSAPGRSVDNWLAGEHALADRST